MHIIPSGIEDRRMIADFARAGSTAAAAYPCCPPRLEFELKEHLSPKNPYFKTARTRFFVAYDHNRPVGRISAQIDEQNPHTQNGKIGHFGFCAAREKEVFKALVNEAENWLKQNGCIRISGPYSLSINDEVGLLINGFERAPRIMMNYAPEWMGRTLEESGYNGIKDLLAYDLAASSPLPRAAETMIRHARNSKEISIRPVRLNALHDDLEIIRGIFNRGWAQNWGFIPMEKEDITYMASTIKPILDPDLAHIAFVNGTPAAMIVALPDINDAIEDLNGRLLPFGWARLLWRAKVRKLKSARVLLMGIAPEYQSGVFGSALSLLMISEVFDAVREKNMEVVELSWILEDNEAIKRLIETIGGVVTRRYRIFDKKLT